MSYSLCNCVNLSYSAVEELAANFDAIYFICGEMKKKLSDLDQLKCAVENLRSKYLIEVREYRDTTQTSTSLCVTNEINKLLKEKEDIMKKSTKVMNFVNSVNNELDEGGYEKELNWEHLLCPDSGLEEYRRRFKQIQLDLYQKLDNEYMLANEAAMLSYYAYHQGIR
jgi:hypothetical protein